MAKVTIFSDLDGTLLHPKTYSFEEAKSAIRLIKETSIPLVLCSSKTRAEIDVYRKRLGNSHPFVSENGGGIFVPKGYFKSVGWAVPTISYDEYETIVIGSPYQEIRKTFLELKLELNAKVIGFGDMTAREVAAISGLTEEEGTLAKEREFGDRKSVV